MAWGTLPISAQHSKGGGVGVVVRSPAAPNSRHQSVSDAPRPLELCCRHDVGRCLPPRVMEADFRVARAGDNYRVPTFQRVTRQVQGVYARDDGNA